MTKIANIQVTGHDLDLLILAVSYASANRDDLNEATNGDIQEYELSKLLEFLEAKK